MIVIKKLGKDRWREHRNLRLEALKNDPIAFESSYEEEKDLSEEKWRKRAENTLFALSNNTPIGMIVFIYGHKKKRSDVVTLCGLYVTKVFRGQGAGKKLLESALSEIRKENDNAHVTLTVNCGQVVAIKLYKTCGFEYADTLKEELMGDGNFYDLLMMEKSI